jgi:hypothetical protein
VAFGLDKQQDDFVRQAFYYLELANKTDVFDVEKKISYLKEVEKCFANLKEPMIAQLVDTIAKLLKDNNERENKDHSAVLVDKNLRETFIWLVGRPNCNLNEAEYYKKQYKLTDKQFWYLIKSKLRVFQKNFRYWTTEGFAQCAKWHHFEQFGRSKKSPIGYLVRQLLEKVYFIDYACF